MIKVVEHVVNTSTDPHVNRVAGADLGQMPTAGELSRVEKAKASARCALRPAFRGLVARVQLGKVKTANVRPGRTNLMILGAFRQTSRSCW